MLDSLGEPHDMNPIHPEEFFLERVKLCKRVNVGCPLGQILLGILKGT